MCMEFGLLSRLTGDDRFEVRRQIASSLAQAALSKVLMAALSSPFPPRSLPRSNPCVACGPAARASTSSVPTSTSSRRESDSALRPSLDLPSLPHHPTVLFTTGGMQ